MENSIELYKKMYLIKRSEDVIIENYFDNEMKTPMHMSRGEEAIVVGVCEALNEDDQVFGTYRSHALYLAKTGDTDGFFAEIYGKKTGICEGKAGSMHLANPSKGHISCSAIVGSNISVAVGAAWANKKKKNGKIVAVFFGEGAMDEGNFWESINIACLWKLPIVFICEDNGLAVHTSSRQRQGYEFLNEILYGFDLCYSRGSDSDDTNAFDSHENASSVVKYVRKNNEPGFIHYKYYRHFEHVGVIADSDEEYLNKKEVEKLKQYDPVIWHRKYLIKKDIDVESIEKEIDEKIYKSLEFAKSSPFPELNEMYKDVYCE